MHPCCTPTDVGNVVPLNYSLVICFMFGTSFLSLWLLLGVCLRVIWHVIVIHDMLILLYHFKNLN